MMNTKQAVASRIVNLCREKGIAIDSLGNLSGLNPSTIYSILNTKSKNPGIVTIKIICDGLNISLIDFFTSVEFENLDQEIK